MALQLLLAARRDDQISHLRRQKAPQTAHAFDFAYLVGDTLFELLVQFGKFLGLCCQLVGSLAQFVEQPRVLNGNYRLIGESSY